MAADKRRSDSQSGFTLVELLFVLGCLAIIFVMISGVMFSMSRAMRDGKSLYSHYEAVYGLVPWLKGDVSKGTDVELLDGSAETGGNRRLVIRLKGDGKIIYEKGNAGLRRIVSPSGTERNVLPAWLTAEFHVTGGGKRGRDLVKLEIREKESDAVIFSGKFAAGGTE